MQRAIRWMLMFGWIGGFVPLAKAQSPDPANQLARDIFKQLIEINTTDSHGTRAAAEALAARLRAAGFPAADIQIVGPADNPKYANLVARYRGTNHSIYWPSGCR